MTDGEKHVLRLMRLIGTILMVIAVILLLLVRITADTVADYNSFKQMYIATLTGTVVFLIAEIYLRKMGVLED